MDQKDLELLGSRLAGEFDLQTEDLVAPEKIIAALTWRIDQLIAGNPDRLFSLLYRLDISERKIKDAMATQDDVTKKIAVLVYERQLEKILSRKQFRTERPEDDLAW